MTSPFYSTGFLMGTEMIELPERNFSARIRPNLPRLEQYGKSFANSSKIRFSESCSSPLRCLLVLESGRRALPKDGLRVSPSTLPSSSS